MKGVCIHTLLINDVFGMDDHWMSVFMVWYLIFTAHALYFGRHLISQGTVDMFSLSLPMRLVGCVPLYPIANELERGDGISLLFLSGMA